MENIKIKISKEQAELFEMTGNRAELSDKDVYMNIPYWLKETNEEYVYEYLTVEQLPNDIRNYQPRYSEEDMKKAIKFGADGMYGWQMGEEGYTDNQIKRFLETFNK